jgi:hypothetical protein
MHLQGHECVIFFLHTRILWHRPRFGDRARSSRSLQIIEQGAAAALVAPRCHTRRQVRQACRERTKGSRFFSRRGWGGLVVFSVLVRHGRGSGLRRLRLRAEEG